MVGTTFGARPSLLDNDRVHRLGRMANCLTCHAAGQFEVEKIEHPRE